MRREIENLILTIDDDFEHMDKEEIIRLLFDILKGDYFLNVVWDAGLGLLDVFPELDKDDTFGGIF